MKESLSTTIKVTKLSMAIPTYLATIYGPRANPTPTMACPAMMSALLLSGPMV